MRQNSSWRFQWQESEDSCFLLFELFLLTQNWSSDPFNLYSHRHCAGTICDFASQPSSFSVESPSTGNWESVLLTLLQVRLSFFFFFFFGGGPHTHGIQRFPGWGSNWNCSCQPMRQPQQHQIQASSATYSTAHSNTGSLTPLSEARD